MCEASSVPILSKRSSLGRSKVIEGLVRKCSVLMSICLCIHTPPADQVEGNWKQMKGSVKQNWGKLTDDDLTVAQGQADALAGRLQERYGMSKEEAKKQLDEFVKAHNI